MVKGCDTLDSNLVLSQEVDGQAHNAIWTFSNDIEWLTSGHVYGHRPTSVYVYPTSDMPFVMPLNQCVASLSRQNHISFLSIDRLCDISRLSID